MKTLTIEETAFAHLTTPSAAPRSRTPKLWPARLLTGLPLLFLAWDGVMKFTAIPQVIEASAQLGFERPNLPFLGVVELTGVLLVLFARTRVFGAVLLSAYLGGAVAVHVQHSDPLLTHTLIPIIVASWIWGGLSLLDPRVRALSPFARR
jgi:uncharacterized membrane protein YphA (DoxX/SURF4 family)